MKKDSVNRPQKNDRDAKYIADSTTAKKSSTVKKHHQLWRVLLFFLLLLIILIWLAPHLVSTRMGSGFVVSAVNNRIDEQIQVENLSLAWAGPCQASGVKVWDAQGREIFQLSKVTSARGLWQALISPQDFEQLTLEEPRAVVYVSEQKQKKKARPSTDKDKPAEAPKIPMSFPKPIGQLIIRAGGVRMIQPDGRNYEISQIDGQFDLDTLNDIKGAVQVEVGSAGKIEGKININQLITDNRFSPTEANGSFSLLTDGDVDLGPLLEFAQSKTTAGGKAQMKIEATFKSGQVFADISTKLAALHIEREGAVEIQPIDLNFQGHIESTAEQISGQGKLTGQAGDIHTNFTYTLSEQPISVSSEDLMGAVLTGKAIELPDFSLEVDGHLDIPALAAAVPALLKVQPGLQVSNGQLKIDKVSIRGTNNAAATGAIRLVDFVAQRERQTIVFTPVSADFDMYLEPDVGLQIRRAEMKSAFAQFSASGTPSRLKGNFAANLNKLYQQIDQFLELPAFELAGVVNGTLDVDRTDKEQVIVDLEMTGKGIHYRMNERQVDVEDLEIIYKGSLSTNEQESPRSVIGTAKVSLDNQSQRGSGSKTNRELMITHNIELDRHQETITVKDTQIKSQMLSAQISGEIKEYKSVCTLALNGWYEGSWEKITALIHEIVPETTETFYLRGVSKSNFSITGPARQAQIRPVYRGVNSGIDVGWTSGEVYGIALGQALLPLALRNAKVSLSQTTIPAAGGKIHFSGLMVNLDAEEPTLEIPGQVQLLEDVQLNPTMGRQLLSRINPIFANMARVQGKVSLLLKDVALPLSEQIKHRGSGWGHLDTTLLKFQPDGLLADLMRLGGLSADSTQTINVPGVNFTITDGRINYDNFIVKYSEDFELRFYGSVGFDDTIDLVVSLPIRAPLLQRFGVQGPVMDYVRLLEGASVDIPVIGTRLDPKLDFAQVNIQPLIERALDNLLREKAQEVLKDIFKTRKTKKPDTSPDKSQKPPDSQSPARDVFDILIDVIEQQSNSSKKDENHD